MSAFLPFVELEMAHAIGPEEGRYLVGGDDGSGADVLQVRVVGAPPLRDGKVLRRNRAARDEEGPREVSVLRVTWIGASQPDKGKLDAQDRLNRLRREEDEREELIEAVLGVVNLAVRAHRAGARDAYIAELTRHDPRDVRLGFGTAQELAGGGWTEAFRPPPPRVPRIDRSERLGPTDVVVLALSGRLGLLEAEELALRALCDVDQDRPRAAALQARACVELLASELREAVGDRAEVAAWAEEIAELEPRAATLAAIALEDRLGADGPDQVLALLDVVDGVLARWRAPEVVRGGRAAAAAPQPE